MPTLTPSNNNAHTHTNTRTHSPTLTPSNNNAHTHTNNTRTHSQSQRHDRRYSPSARPGGSTTLSTTL